MNDIKGFCKLLDLNIPDIDNFDYYIEQLSKIDTYKNIRDLIKLYEDAESEYGNLFDLRISRSNDIINYIRKTRAYNELIDDNLIPSYQTTNNFKFSEGVKYLSIDIIKANWRVYKEYDPPFLNEMCDSYEDLLSKFGLPEIFNHSKQLRQYIFGNLNPKRQSKVQRNIMESILDKYEHLNINLLGVKNDEVIYSFNKMEDIKEILDTLDIEVFKPTIFTVEQVEDFRINTFISDKDEVLYRKMIGCNGNMFYMNFKKYILNEPIDIRDLYFRVDGRIAIWKV